ncbi:MAG: major capsid protein E [Rhizobiales bacterium]|nr:major capsid protein E [Hyphomicrobiales bacterium]MBA68631.1 major capsid protein E [Hyphomicrobiales bacterium]|tara:strand:- start:639 stop:1664 length:1026 start_codon:yes stop_codon:yes gene_type:complete
MALVTDIFTQNGWGVIEYQEEVVENVDFKPQLLGELGIFEPLYSRSSTIAIAAADKTLTLIPTSATGEAPQELIPKGARVKKFDASRLAKGSTVFAIEMAGVTALPFELQTKEVSEEITDRTAQILDDLELTWEHMRFGAIQGKVLDADGTTVLVNWFQEWGIAEPAEVNFALTTPGTDVRKKCRDVKRAMQKAAKGAWTPATRVAGLCGDDYFDALVNHPQIKETKLGTERAPMLEDIEGYSAIEIEGITFINYRGTDDESKIAIGTDKVRFFPVGKGFFKAGFAPANEFKPYLNQRAREYYGLILADTSGRDAWDRVELYSYPLMICTRPGTLLSGKKA